MLCMFDLCSDNFVWMSGLRHAVFSVADFIGSRRTDIVPVHNSTSAINSVLQSVTLEEDDLYLMTSLSYPSVGASHISNIFASMKHKNI